MEHTIEYLIINRFSKIEVVNQICSDSKMFDSVVMYAFSDEQPISWRAAWLLNHCMAKNDSRILPFVKNFIDAINDKKDGHQRELLKILEKLSISDEHEGYLFDSAMTIWEAIGKSPSVRIKAFDTLARIAKKYPELKNELKFLAESHYLDSLSPGIRKSFERRYKE